LAISAYLLFRHLQDRFQDVADFYYGFEHDGRISGATSSESSASSGFGAGDGVSSDGRYKRELIIVFGSERLMLSFLPKANYAVLAMSLLACACLLFLAVVDLGEARYYHGTASAMFFALSIIQSLFLTSLIYALRRVQTLHNRQSNLRFYWKVITLLLCLFCTFPVAVLEAIIMALTGSMPSETARHNVGVLNQYLLTGSLLLHFFSYSYELSAVDVSINLRFDAVERIIALGPLLSTHSSSTSFLYDSRSPGGYDVPGSGQSKFSIGEEESVEEEQGIRFVNKGKSREMQEMIPVEVLDIKSTV